ncbi:MAG: aldehyde dehydrogenase [Clostridiaceae bacterium]|nr:aldehyde dehydrogenase [Clostridiaceae bacterium]
MKDIKKIRKKQQSYFYTGATKDVSFRMKQLSVLKQAVLKYEDRILEALKKDLNKSAFEAYETEVGVVLTEITHTVKHLKAWAKSEKVKTPFTHFLSRSYIYAEPYGVVLIMAPWNYPFQLMIAPLIGGIAAGNCCILKPSEYATHTAKVLVNLIEEYFEEKFVAVIEGGKDVNERLLEENFDYIFFTGSIPVGKIVMEAAAKHLTPVTLELGGKSPCIVDKDVDLKKAAKKIIWGKFLNAGQTCVAPDYVYVHTAVKEELIQYMKDTIKNFFGEDPKESEDYVRIINHKHLHRLSNLLVKDKILFGGEVDPEQRYIAPTIMAGVTWEDAVMEDEIFGPILPILEYHSIDEVIDKIRNFAKPLALYVFTKNKHIEKEVIDNLSFGGGCVNDTIMHLASPYLPFGGVGPSGMGAYHGKASFDVFSHRKSILRSSTLFDIKFKYPPYPKTLNLLKKIMK